jgi:hypothetical protein
MCVRSCVLRLSHEMNRVSEIENRIQLDGRAGIPDLYALVKGELSASACSLQSKNRVAILTGFPCLLEFTPPTETDGPLGAVALAKTLLYLGKEVFILTDECNEEPMLACAAGCGIFGPRLHLESFPARDKFDDDDFNRLLSLSRSIFLLSCYE